MSPTKPRPPIVQVVYAFLVIDKYSCQHDQYVLFHLLVKLYWAREDIWRDYMKRHVKLGEGVCDGDVTWEMVKIK